MNRKGIPVLIVRPCSFGKANIARYATFAVLNFDILKKGLKFEFAEKIRNTEFQKIDLTRAAR